MNADGRAAWEFLGRAMVARVATQSRSGRPSITPLYFVCVEGHIWLGTSSWTLAAREAKANPRVSVLFQMELNQADRRILRVTGSCKLLTDAKTIRSNNFRTAVKYILTPRGIWHYLSHLHLFQLNRRYHAQSAQKGMASVIDVTPELFEFLNDETSST